MNQTSAESADDSSDAVLSHFKEKEGSDGRGCRRRGREKRGRSGRVSRGGHDPADRPARWGPESTSAVLSCGQQWRIERSEKQRRVVVDNSTRLGYARTTRATSRRRRARAEVSGGGGRWRLDVGRGGGGGGGEGA